MSHLRLLSRPAHNLENAQSVENYLHGQRGLQYRQHPSNYGQYPSQTMLEDCFVVPQCQQVENHHHKQKYNNHYLIRQIMFVE